MSFTPSENRYLNDCGGGLLMKTEDVKKLDLMIGDVLDDKARQR
jgi:hypothetical protein